MIARPIHVRFCACTLLLLMLVVSTGCVRRTMTITTEPAQSLVFINGEEVGRSQVQRDFTWYGDYDITIRREGYETLHTNWQINAPWYQYIPLDFFFEVLWPWELHDQRSHQFVLENQTLPSTEDLVERAIDMRHEAIPFE